MAGDFLEKWEACLLVIVFSGSRSIEDFCANFGHNNSHDALEINQHLLSIWEEYGKAYIKYESDQILGGNLKFKLGL